MSAGVGRTTRMFDRLPAEISALRGGAGAAPFVDAAVGWARMAAMSEAQRLACIAEWAAIFLSDSGDDDACLCAVDVEDDVVAQIGIAFGISVYWDDGVGSRFVIHIYAEAEALDRAQDPLIHGDGPIGGPKMNVTITPRNSPATADADEGEDGEKTAPEDTVPQVESTEEPVEEATPEPSKRLRHAPDIPLRHRDFSRATGSSRMR